MVFGLPLRFGLTWPLSSMLAESERRLNVARENLGRFSRWRLLEMVKKVAEAIFGERGRDSLVGVTRVGKQGRNVNGLELILILPPTRATSCIQLASGLSWRWAAVSIVHWSILLLLLTTSSNSFERFDYPRLSRHGNPCYTNPFLGSVLTGILPRSALLNLTQADLVERWIKPSAGKVTSSANILILPVSIGVDTSYGQFLFNLC